MKQIISKLAYLRLAAVFMLLMETVTVSAQYYLNVFKKNGTKVEYLISDLDSITFSSYVSPIIPENKKYVSKFGMTYNENFESYTRIDPFSILIRYDNQNRITSFSLSSSYGTDNYNMDYSKPGMIVLTKGENDSIFYYLDNSGFVNAVEYDIRMVKIEYDGEYVSKLKFEPKDSELGYYYSTTVDFIREDGVLTKFVTNNEFPSEIIYKYGYQNPQISFDYNWFMYAGFSDFAPLCFGYGGKLSDKLMESVGPHAMTDVFDYNPNETQSGTYHYEKKYNELNTSKLENMIIEKDEYGRPVSIIYSVPVEEFVYSCDYVVEVDTISIKEDGVITDKKWYRLPETEKREPTGTTIGLNDIIYSFEYKE